MFEGSTHGPSSQATDVPFQLFVHINSHSYFFILIVIVMKVQIAEKWKQMWFINMLILIFPDVEGLKYVLPVECTLGMLNQSSLP